MTNAFKDSSTISRQKPVLGVLFKVAKNVIKTTLLFVTSANKDIEKKKIIVNNVVRKTVLIARIIKIIVNSV